MVYLIGGMPGMRKTTIISPCVRAQKSIGFISTDVIRAYIKDLFTKAGGDPQKIELNEYPELRNHDDALGWIGTAGLVQLFNREQKDVLIEGIDNPPTGIRDLELRDPNLKVRAAFVGYSKTIEFQPPEWTPELEKLFESAIGKADLEKAKKCDWVYRDKEGKPSPYDKPDESKRIESAVEKIRASGSENYKYFDLIDYVPSERQGGEIADVRLEDYIKMAVEVRSFLFENAPDRAGSAHTLPRP